MVASIPIIVLLMILDIGITIAINPQTPAISTWSAIFACISLAMAPLFLQITREISLTSSIVIFSLLFSIFTANYISPSLTDPSYFYFPLGILFGVLISGYKHSLAYLITSYIFAGAQYLRVAEKFENVDPLFLERALSQLQTDFPTICTITYAITAYYDYQRVQKSEQEKLISVQMAKQQATLSKSVRDSAIGEMAGGIAHEINNPLFAISGTVEQALKDPSISQLNPRLVEKLRRVKNHSQRIHSLIDRLLQFGSNENPGDDFVDVQAAINESIRMQKRYLEQAEIEFNSAGSSFKLQIDLFSLMKILNNLITNSRQEIEKQNKPWIKIHISNDGVLGYIDVIDSGNGIGKDVSGKIFQPFFTTKEIGQGAGLGLSESLGLVKTFEGDLQYQLHSGNTCFRIILPLAKA